MATKKQPQPQQEESTQEMAFGQKQPKINIQGQAGQAFTAPPPPAQVGPAGFQPLPQVSPLSMTQANQQFDPQAQGGGDELVQLLKGLFGNAL